MKKVKVTQVQTMFYKLYEARKLDKEKYTPIFELIGEAYVKPIGVWGFVSYEVSARMSEMFKKNPKLLERKYIIGKSGAKYYAYRLSINVTPADIVDLDLKEFYDKCKNYYIQSAFITN
jgi:hypothetical protein